MVVSIADDATFRQCGYVAHITPAASINTRICSATSDGLGYGPFIWNLYKIDLPFRYGFDDNTSLKIVQRLTYIAAGEVDTWYTDSGGGCGSSSGYKEFLNADDDDGILSIGTPHMRGK